MANRNWASGGKIYSMHVSPVLLDCNFQVASSEANGISNLKGPAIRAVYMASSASSPSATNPADGTIIVQLSDNYPRAYGISKACIQSPLSGSALKVDNSELTAGVAYVITVLGDATAADLHALGVPAGITPAVGVAFVAASVGAGANSSSTRVQAVAAAGSGVASIEILGAPSLALNPSPSASVSPGGQIILQCRDYAGALVAPADGSIISLEMYLSNSSITVQGE